MFQLMKARPKLLSNVRPSDWKESFQEASAPVPLVIL